MIRMMNQGQTGPDILAVQQALNIRLLTNGVRINEDGIFGPKTDGAVREFQRLNQLKVDGIVGPITRSVLYPLVATTVNIFGTRTGEPRDSGIQQRVAAALSPGQLRLRGNALPASQGAAAAKVATGLGFPQPSARFQLESLRLPGLASPVQAPAQPAPSNAFQLDSFQGSAGFQRSFTSLFKDPQDAFGLSLQTVFLRNKDDGHLEFAPGLQIGAPLFGASSDSAAWTLSWFANFTWVDPLGHLGLFHFWWRRCSEHESAGRDIYLGTSSFLRSEWNVLFFLGASSRMLRITTL
jgi:hypothetical protein